MLARCCLGFVVISGLFEFTVISKKFGLANQTVVFRKGFPGFMKIRESFCDVINMLEKFARKICDGVSYGRFSSLVL